MQAANLKVMKSPSSICRTLSLASIRNPQNGFRDSKKILAKTSLHMKTWVHCLLTWELVHLLEKEGDPCVDHAKIFEWATGGALQSVK